MTHEQALQYAKTVFSRVEFIKTRMFQQHGFPSDLKMDLSLDQFHVLGVVRELGPMSLTELAEALKVSAPSASGMVDRLVQKGFLSRETCEEDRRKVVIQVSARAAKNMQTVEERILASLVDLIQRIGPQTAEQWCAVLAQIKEAVEEKGSSR